MYLMAKRVASANLDLTERHSSEACMSAMYVSMKLSPGASLIQDMRHPTKWARRFAMRIHTNQRSQSGVARVQVVVV